jgi:ADP-heptose:LPS heptosyltransferase
MYTVRADDQYLRFMPDTIRRVSRRTFSQIPPRSPLTRVTVDEALSQDTDTDLSVLISRDMGAGDVVIATGLAHHLKTTYPHVAVHFQTAKRHVGLLEGHPDLDGVHVIGDVDPWDFTYDVNLVRRSEVIPDASYKVRSDMYFEEAGCRSEVHKTRIVLSKQDIVDAETTLRTYGFDPLRHRYRLALQPAGSGYHRSLSHTARRDLAVLARDAGWDVVVYGNDTSHFPDDVTGAANLCGKLADIRQVAGIISCCDLWVGPDSAGYHLAAALDPPVDALVCFSTVPPYLRLRDYPRCWAVTPENLNCFPCVDRPSCGGAYFCVNQHLTAERIFEKAKQIAAGTLLREIPIVQDHVVTS